MPLPDKSTIANYGGSRIDGTSAVNPRTDVTASGFNPMTNDIGMMSVLCPRVWIAFHWVSGTTLVVDGNDEMWNGTSGYSAPTPAYSTTGTYTIAYPSTVLDFIGSTDPAGGTVHTLSLRAGRGSARDTTGTMHTVSVIATSGNVLTVRVGTGGSLVDTASLVIDVTGW